jgi:hypothetical protein
MSTQGGLRQLAEVANADFPELFAARERTASELEDRRQKLSSLACDQDVAVGLMGSWGRSELTSESDDDFMLLIDGPLRNEFEPSMEQVRAVLGREGRAPGPEDIFGQPVSAVDLREKIGLDRDNNANLTRRMLLLLESVPACNSNVWDAVRQSCLDGNMSTEVKPYRPPRFLLNDIVRYWRTVAVDFEAKHRSREGEGWGLRNAKLRLSRKLLFSSGLLPVLECHSRTTEEIPGFLAERFALLPTDRVAEAFLAYDAVEPGVRTFRAYDEFLKLLNDSQFRAALKTLALEDADTSPEFQRVRHIGREFQAGLLSLLFDTDELYPLVREFAIY